jgi:hypothetical protein
MVLVSVPVTKDNAATIGFADAACQLPNSRHPETIQKRYVQTGFEEIEVRAHGPYRPYFLQRDFWPALTSG